MKNIFFAICGIVFLGLPSYTDQKGVLDLSNYDGKSVISLDTYWEFYPGTAVRPFDKTPAKKDYRYVPDTWQGEVKGLAERNQKPGTGIATYKLKLINYNGYNKLALRLSTIVSSYELYVNGNLLSSVGRVSPIPDYSVSQFDPQVVRIGENTTDMEITMVVSNWEFRTGGIWRPIDLGPESKLVSDKMHLDIIIYMILSAILFMALNGLVFFIFRKSDVSYLYFSLFSLCIAFRILTAGEYIITDLFPDISFSLVLRIEYGSIFLALITSVLFLRSVLFAKLSKPYFWLMISPGVIFFVLNIILPTYTLTRVIFIFYILVPLSFFFMFYKIIIPAIKQRITGSFLIFGGSLFVFLGAINDILYSSFIIHTGDYLPYTILIFMIFQLTILAKRYVTALSTVENNSRELFLANKRLTQELSDGIAKSYKLEMLVNQNDELLKEVHHRVKNSLEIVSSIIKLQGNRIEDKSVKSFLKSLQQRISAISLVHEKLYKQMNHALLDLVEYASDLTEFLKRGIAESNLTFNRPSQSIAAPIEFCIDMGLIISELVSNAIKYGQSESGAIEIEIALGIEGEHIFLTVSDTGKGFSPDFNSNETSGLGYKLIKSMLTRSKGSIEHFRAGKWNTVKVSMVL